MKAQCLSVTGPCKELCEICIKSHIKYYEDAERKIVTEAIRALESRGYKVLHPSEIDDGK